LMCFVQFRFELFMDTDKKVVGVFVRFFFFSRGVTIMWITSH
jgi:hypothetical protein